MEKAARQVGCVAPGWLMSCWTDGRRGYTDLRLGVGPAQLSWTGRRQHRDFQSADAPLQAPTDLPSFLTGEKRFHAAAPAIHGAVLSPERMPSQASQLPATSHCTPWAVHQLKFVPFCGWFPGERRAERTGQINSHITSCTTNSALRALPKAGNYRFKPQRSVRDTFCAAT